MDPKSESEEMLVEETVKNPAGDASGGTADMDLGEGGDAAAGGGATAAGTSFESKEEEGDHNLPVVIIMVGMAASGKTTLTQRITSELMRRGTPPYIINLDPACLNPPYPVNIDIRDVVKYKKVMELYNLGPNGAIVTSLNLFSTKFDEVINIVKQKRKLHQYVIIDTPGQIEVFMWSASGSIITESLAAMFPTVMIYVTDLISNVNPTTFISNMTYACSILYKTKLPLVVALNKCDAVDPTFAKEWMTDYEAFEAALQTRNEYTSNLASSLALSLEEFYNKIEHVVVSAYDGFGMNEFFSSVQKSVDQYETVYRPTYKKLMEERKANAGKKQKQQLDKLRRDLQAEGDTQSCFVVPGRDAGTGLTLRLDNEDDSSSEEDEDAHIADENEEESFSQVLNRETSRRTGKYSEGTNSSSSSSHP